VSLTLGVSLLLMGPGLSARMRYTLPSPNFGTRARASTNTPMPPIHWVWARQNSTPKGCPSIKVNTVAPVVVKPDTVSNTASA
jgi:hypothetical protein